MAQTVATHENDASCTPKARIIIVSFNCADYLNRVLKSLILQTEPDFEVVVVDNASADVDKIRMPDDSRFRLWPQTENLGFARGNNVGAAGATAPWIITLNPDAFPRPDWLSRLLAAAEKRPDVAMFGSTQLFDHDPDIIDGEGDRYSIYGFAWRVNYRLRRGAPYFSGAVFTPCACAAMYRRDMFEKVGGFDESYFCYVEDVDLGFRIRLAGGEALQVGDAVVQHISSGVSKQYGDFSIYHGVRNLVFTIMKDVPGPLLFLVVPLFIAMVTALLLFHWKPRKFPVIKKSLTDGLRGASVMLARRRTIQGERAVSAWEIARRMSWSPIDMLLRR